MTLKAARAKNPAAVALGRKGGKNGGPARAAKLTPEQRSESARKAVQARWAKAKEGSGMVVAGRTAMKRKPVPTAIADASDRTLLALLKSIKATDNPAEIRRLAEQLERVIFHKQLENA
jgi:hypothetical protein